MGRSSGSDFSLSILRIAVSQICESVGYDAAQTSALDTLSDVAACYLGAIAKSAVDSANSCGRTQSNLFDIIIALEDLSSGQGIPGASSSRITNSIVSSSLLKEIKKFVSYTDEIPFAQPLPREKLPTFRRPGGHGIEKGSSYCHRVKLGHIPRWLPEMPVIKEKELELEKGGEISSWNMMLEGEETGKRERRVDGKGFELPEKRGKVRFKMGVSGRGEIGKRVLCHSLGSGHERRKEQKEEEEEEEEEPTR